MKKVFQSEATDCLRACVASITGEDNVPDFSSNSTNWMRNMKRWLARRGFVAKVINDCGEIDGRCYSIVAVDPYIFGVGVFAHAVVMRGKRVIHDPGRRNIKKSYELAYGLEIRKV